VSKGRRSAFIQGRYRPGMEKVNRINQYEVFGRDRHFVSFVVAIKKPPA